MTDQKTPKQDSIVTAYDRLSLVDKDAVNMMLMGLIMQSVDKVTNHREQATPADYANFVTYTAREHGIKDTETYKVQTAATEKLLESVRGLVADDPKAMAEVRAAYKDHLAWLAENHMAYTTGESNALTDGLILVDDDQFDAPTQLPQIKADIHAQR